MNGNQYKLIIVLLVLIVILLSIAIYQLYMVRVDNQNYETNLKAYLQTI